MSDDTQHSISQTNFQETPYEDASWPVVKELEGEIDFQPLEMEDVTEVRTAVDPMFADYGGLPGNVRRRWHLPDDLSWQPPSRKEEAEAEEARTIGLTQEQIEAIQAEAFAKGREAGMAEVGEQQNQKLQGLEQKLGAILKDLISQLQEQVNRVEQQATGLAIDISKKIVDTAVEINPEYILKVIHEAIALSGSAKIRKVRVSSQDLEFIEIVGASRMIKEFDGTWAFEADNSVRSGCIVETSAGEIDYRLDEAWERVRDTVVKVAR